VTFHKRIASSGYGKAPIMKLHAGGPSTAAAAAAKASAALNLGRGAAALARRYTPAEGPMSHLQAANSAAAPPLNAPLLRMAFAPDAGRLALAASDGSVSLMRLPARRHYSAGQAPPALAGHSGAVHAANFSFTGRLLVTASADGSACLWDVAPDRPPAAPLMRLEHAVHSPEPGGSGGGGGGGGGSSSSNPKFGGEVRDARFFYLDRLLLLCQGNGVHLYSYALQRQPSHDAARAPELRHRYRLAHKAVLPRAQHVTCLAACNSLLSPLVVAAGSDRSLVAMDLGVGGTPVVELADAHERPIHTLRLASEASYATGGGGGGGGAAAAAAEAGHDLVLSAALDGVVKLWDLRSASCVRKFEAHVNRTTPVGASISPCLRYVCCGSEDRSAYLYDARGGGLVERLRHGSDVVIDAAFSPLHPQLALAGLDGSVRFFADRPAEGE
jgi:WD40 repeat protein